MSHPRFTTLLAALVLGLGPLSACQTEETAAPDMTEACGAEGLQDLLGAPVAEQDFSGIGGAQRVLAEGSPMTMDYRHDRLNVTYDGTGAITRIWCG